MFVLNESPLSLIVFFVGEMKVLLEEWGKHRQLSVSRHFLWSIGIYMIMMANRKKIGCINYSTSIFKQLLFFASYSTYLSLSLTNRLLS